MTKHEGALRRRILAPHKEQDGWCYIRVPNAMVRPLGAPVLEDGPRTHITIITKWWLDRSGIVGLRYTDDHDGSRVISSRRVEEAVETDDYFKRCADEGLTVCRLASGMWSVWRPCAFPITCYGSTLREAYWRYKNSAERALRVDGS